MRLIKYDGAPDSTKTTILGGGSSSSSGGGESGGGASRGDDASRKIWGQNDTGDDIDGTQTVHGNVIIKAITPPTYDPDDEGDDGDNEEQEEGGGSLDVEVDVTVGRHLYITNPHPYHKGEKKCVGEMLNELYNIVCPIGTIVAFNGGQSIPDNWVVCDGTNGTPDLSGRFIKGTSNRTEVGTTGGQTEIKITSTSLPRHSHDFKFVPADWFVMASSYNLPTVNVAEGDGTLTALSAENIDTIGSINGVTDEAGDDVADTPPINIEPPYYTLIYIMRVK